MAVSRVRPLAMPALVTQLADRIAAAAPERRLRVGVDGAAAADPDTLADALAEVLRVRGRATLRIRSADFLRPASVRLELGRNNPESFYERWLDEPGLRREVLDLVVRTGRVLPSLWDAETDRATRAPYVTVPPGGVVLVSGALLLGGGLPFDFIVHIALSPPRSPGVLPRTSDGSCPRSPATSRTSAPPIWPMWWSGWMTRAAPP